MSDNRLKQKKFDRVFIVGAGSSYPAGIPLGKDLLEVIVKNAYSDEKQKFLVPPVINRLKSIYPKFTGIESVWWPQFEEYLDLFYDLSKGSNIAKVPLPVEVEDAKYGFDVEAILILYWFLHHTIKNFAYKSSSRYLPLFIQSEVGETDAVISLNYDWLFEYFLFFKEDGKDVETIQGNIERVPDSIKRCYGPNATTKIKLFKPHGSSNWFTGVFGDEQSVITSDRGTLPIVIGRDFFPRLFGKDNCIYMYFPFWEPQVLKTKNDIPCIVPPQGFKGFFGSKIVIKNLAIKNPEKVKQYNLFSKSLGLEGNSCIKAIHKASKEIWLIGTSLLVDPYLLHQVKLRKLIKPEVRIKLIDPVKSVAQELANTFGQIEWYKGGGIEEYSNDLKYEKIKTNKWLPLSNNRFEIVKSQ